MDKRLLELLGLQGTSVNPSGTRESYRVRWSKMAPMRMVSAVNITTGGLR